MRYLRGQTRYPNRNGVLTPAARQAGFCSTSFNDGGCARDLIKVNRDSSDSEIMKGYRWVVLKVRPDKGGNTKKFQKLQAAREAWERARKDGAPAGLM